MRDSGARASDGEASEMPLNNNRRRALSLINGALAATLGGGVYASWYRVNRRVAA